MHARRLPSESSVHAGARRLVSCVAQVDMRRAMKLLLASAVLVACASCRTIETNEVARTLPSPRVGKRVRTWEVRCGGEPLGHVVLFQEHGLARDSLYVVRNPWNQDLGLIDGLGRAFRYVPHREEPAWVGSGTIAAGAQQILGSAEPCELIELAEPTLEAAAEATRSDARVPAAHTSGSSARTSEVPPADVGLPQSR